MMDHAAARHVPVEVEEQHALGELPATVDERAAHRFTLLIRAAKLISSQGEFLCVIRDLSATGISLRLFHPLPVGSRMALEFQTGDTHEVERVWAREGEAGFRFCDDIDIEAAIAEIGAYPKRKLRLRIEMPAQVCSHGRTTNALVHNISQQGAKIESEEVFACDQLLRLKAEGLPEVAAKIRWSRNGCYGLVFENTFSLRELAQLAVALQCPSLLDGACA